MRKTVKLSICSMALFGFAVVAMGAEPIVYPAKGQTQAQQDKDRTECRQWAIKETGVDPNQLPAVTSSGQTTQNRGQVVRSAAKGAAVGGLGGSMGGEFGKGAAAGAAVGAAVGGVRKLKDRKAQSTADAAAQQQRDAQQQKYDKAFGVCMQGRDYTVQY
jgi:hypothetical protein